MEIEKAIQNFKVKFTSSLNMDQDEYIHLKMELSDDLRDLLKQCIVPNSSVAIPREYAACPVDVRSRPKIKGWIATGFSCDVWPYIFCNGSVETGVSSYKFNSIRTITRFVEDIKGEFRSLINTIIRAKNLNHTVVYNVEARE